MLSNSDIAAFFRSYDWPVRIITYSAEVKLDKNLPTVILYETAPRVGQWTILFYDHREKIFIFFDPYGVFMDDQLKYSIYGIKQKYSLTKKILNYLGPREAIDINDVQFQTVERGDVNCGRWCCLRYWAYRHEMPFDEFKGLSPQRVIDIFGWLDK